MPRVPPISSDNPARFLSDLAQSYDQDLVPRAVAAQLGLSSAFPLAMVLSDRSAADQDAWVYRVGGRSFTRAQLRTAAQAVVGGM